MIRQARRLEEDDRRVGTQIDVSSEDEPLVRPIDGRNVVARRESRKHDFSEVAVISCDADEDGEPMATHPATQSELREAGVVMSLSSPPPFEVIESLERDLVGPT